ncbi:MAG: DNA recombination protein RmuC [Spirochaetota bacterium]
MHVSLPVVASGIALLLFLSCLLIVMLFRQRHGAGQGTHSDTHAALASMAERLNTLAGMSEQLQDLSRIFTVPRTRGEIGETMMADLLRTYLPPDAYTLQYRFPDGSRVDALVHLVDVHIPIDSKFPLEAIRKFLAEHPANQDIPHAIRKTFTEHAKAIRDRYIQPESGTTPYALMYIPSEGLYHRLFVTDTADTMQEFLGMRVIPVSPGTLFLYLLTVAHAMRGIAFQARVSELADLVSAVRRMLEETDQAHVVLRTHLKNAAKAAGETERKLARLGDSIDRLEGR